MIKPLQHSVALRLLTAALAALSATGLFAQTTTPSISRNIVVLDPAHGGSDNGASIASNLPEKQFTLAFADRLKPLLAAAGFAVVLTRDADPTATTPLLPDQRAGTANHVRALACILIHATLSGAGAHIFTSTLKPSDQSADSATPTPWNAAQTPYLPLSLRLANQLGLSLIHANIPTTLSLSAIRPIDNLTCPAVALELAPTSTPLTDATYQQHAAQAITAALVAWRNQQPPPPPAPKPAPPTTPAPTPALTPNPTPEGLPQ